MVKVWYDADMKLQPIILAAGKGTRMQSDVPKPLYEIDGQPMLAHVLKALEASDVCLDPVIVVGSWTDAIQNHFGDRYRYAVQTKVDGTATAVAVALPLVDTSTGAPPLLVLYADHPFISPDTIATIAHRYEAEQPTLAMCTVTVPDFAEWRAPFASFGRILRGAEGNVERIVERKNATNEEQQITEVNPALYCMQSNWLRTVLPTIKPNPLTHEYYLTDVLEIATLSEEVVVTIPLPPQEALGINSVADAENAKLRRR